MYMENGHKLLIQRLLRSLGRISKSPICFFRWLAKPFYRTFLPVWSQIYRSKILPVTSRQLTNRTVCDIIFSLIIWFKFIQAKQVDLETSSLARSQRDLMHWSSLRSIFKRGLLAASLIPRVHKRYLWLADRWVRQPVAYQYFHSFPKWT